MIKDIQYVLDLVDIILCGKNRALFTKIVENEKYT
jgi:hypothetical protein